MVFLILGCLSLQMSVKLDLVVTTAPIEVHNVAL